MIRDETEVALEEALTAFVRRGPIPEADVQRAALGLLIYELHERSPESTVALLEELARGDLDVERDPGAVEHADAAGRATQAFLVGAFRRALDYCDTQYTEVRPGVAAGPNLPELIREALEVVASERDGATALVRHRPGCWEADHVMALLGLERVWDDQPGIWGRPS